jgi:hypothetical protein
MKRLEWLDDLRRVAAMAIPGATVVAASGIEGDEWDAFLRLHGTDPDLRPTNAQQLNSMLGASAATSICDRE